ncbi:MAG TPA: type II toxin-antitoxin system RelE/ParE family toxin [Planctomycetes bacterium]|nr:type II toxin-antitoxin system RelE/ParE family toxin [Planctomycetota bacterium]
MARIRIVWTSQAKDDLREIRRFIARDAPRTALAFVWRLRVAVDRLADFPESGRVVPEIVKPEIRELIQGDYRIIYRQRMERVEILTVFHGARLLRGEDLRR